MNKIFISLLLTAISTFTFAKTVATVNGQKIESSLIDKQLSILKTQKVPDNSETRNFLLQTAIIHTLVVQEAKKLKLDQTNEYKDTVKKALEEAKKNGDEKKKDFKQGFELFKENLLEQAYDLHVIKNNPISEQSAKQAYDTIKKTYTGTQEVKLGNIFTHSKDDASKAFNELKKGAKFQDVAKKYSIDNNVKTTGGIDKGYINLKDIQTVSPDLYNVITKLKKDKHSDIIFKNNMYGIVYLNDIRKSQIPSYETIKENIISRLQTQKVQEKIDELVKKSKIDILNNK